MTLDAVVRIELPIIQAPMAAVQDSALAVAVCHAGGLGSLPCAMRTPEAVRREIAAIRAQTDRPFNVNFFCHRIPAADDAREQRWRAKLAPYYQELGIAMSSGTAGAPRLPFDERMADVLVDLLPSIVSFHFGLPSSRLVARLKIRGIKIVSSATTVDEARWLEAHGVDAIIAQGLEAGGHRGHFLSPDLTRQMGTFALLPQVVRAVSVPVIAAGGIADAAGVRAALALGASAVQIGTAYLLSTEATTTAIHRAALASDGSCHTALTNLFTGRPARGIVNRLMRELGPVHSDVPEFPLAATALAPLRSAAEAQGRDDFSPMWAGQNTRGCQTAGAAEVTRHLAG